jgi:hypothetical protein
MASLNWDRDTRRIDNIINDRQTVTQTVPGASGLDAADAFHHPFRYMS